MGCTQISSPYPDNGMSVAAVFGVEWILQGLSRLGNELRKLETVFRRKLGPTVSCDICSESIWLGEAILCSDNAHNYCMDCLTRTIEGMLLGDLALKYDESTTKPLCCFCTHGFASTLPMPSPLLERRWDQRIISSELRNLGLPLLKCVHCGYMVIDGEEETNNNNAPEPPEPPPETLSSSLCRRFLSFIGVESNETEGPPPRQFFCPQCNWTTCLGCSVTMQHVPAGVDSHRCKTEDLRLAIERAVSDRLVYTCPRPSCGHTLLKDGGCNHCTCVCGYEYCHLCHGNLGDDRQLWKDHYCCHFTDDPSARGGVKNGKCILCGKCRLYEDRNDEEIQRSIEERVTNEWKRKQLWDNVRGWFGFA
ncbi:hypothetical protein E1B28_013542 [Marasmius oreades]|uniref:RING-type domain-containing protein n=1 Tax=Marasmius oreades TaxID=181124 RepID=A0A9P7UMW9_9AGAR|nr:uncharacterized protein E1B28_013542 [Marasmius oreades]KAG7087588.1 hypothetical protein E1B28_013542 [Marasmius oreades]